MNSGQMLGRAGLGPTCNIFSLPRSSGGMRILLFKNDMRSHAGAWERDFFEARALVREYTFNLNNRRRERLLGQEAFAGEKEKKS